MTPCFFDSNVLVYALDTTEDRRRGIANDLLVGGGAVGVQCLNEFMSVVTRKQRMAWHAAIEARDQLLVLCSPIVALSLDVHERGMALAERYRLSIWDALIVAAAIEARCETLYTEDMHAGLVIDGRLRIVNPFV